MRRFIPHGSRRRSLLLVGLMGTLVVGLTACYPGGPESLDELGIVLTVKNPEVSFAELRTYALNDEIIELGQDNNSSTPLDPTFYPTILDALQDNMEKRGFTLEEDPQNNKPDLWLEAGAVESTVWVQWYSWGYWGGWGGYYPPYTGVASFQQGTVVWQLLDLRQADLPIDGDDELTGMWLGSINGALKNSTSATHAKITEGINMGFAQSSYIIAAPATKASSVTMASPVTMPGGQEVK